jgi:hypothetical protein
MLVMIPAKGGNAVATPDAELAEDTSETTCPRHHRGVRKTLDTSVRPPVDYCLGSVQRLDMPDDQWNRQRHVHHQSLHARLPFAYGSREHAPAGDRWQG